MAEKSQATDDREPESAAPAAAPPRRPSGHRGTDVRDTVAEMTARAQELSMEAGSRIASAMKDVINAAAGLTGFAIESARDIVQYMVRRGQMTADEGERLMRDVEDAHGRRGVGGAVGATAPAAAATDPVPSALRATALAASETPLARAVDSRPAKGTAEPGAPKAAAPVRTSGKSASRPAPRPTAKGAKPAKPAAKSGARTAAKKMSPPAGRAKSKTPAKSVAAKGAAKGAARGAAKGAVKKGAAKGAKGKR
jgi:hypothetical protein